ncbi:hypothetical protein PVL29_004270 [Vitis rotundifolia]|uniref:Uncharacterized protein n=1 Tax=Vitis rotundifolia TaxID=103349 RepID=A0AA39A7L5_VITRO|nr:hypothetical protein PVL29_004270 [Vitis rotundifolia]
MKMQYLFPSISETPSRINPPALFIPLIIEYILPCSFHSLPHLAFFSSLIQRFNPSKKNPMPSEPNRTHDDTPPFFSTMKPWIFPLLSSTTISNTLDSTVKLHSFLLFRDAELSSPSSPSHSPSHSLSPSLALSLLDFYIYSYIYVCMFLCMYPCIYACKCAYKIV